MIKSTSQKSRSCK